MSLFASCLEGHRSLTRRFSAIAIILITLEPSYALDSRALQQMWLDPPPEYRMKRNVHGFPLDAAGQKSLIEATLQDGWGGFALNAPFNHYLDDAGMKATKQFCELAKAEAMDLWSYDEQGYPSGSAGGRVLGPDISRQSMGLFFTDAIVTGGATAFDMPPGDPVQICAFPVTDDQADYAKPIDLMRFCDGPKLKWNVPQGQWKVFAATKSGLYKGFQAERNSYRYPSLMIPEVTDAFLRITHARYAEYKGNDLGTYFTSTFTDEPSSMAMQFHSYRFHHAVIPWQEILSSEMAKRYGYRPEDKLVELYYDEGPKGQKIRYQYFKTVGDLMAENFFGRIQNWCRSHNLQSGGHLLLEETMIAHVPLYGNIMQCFRAMDAPGIDILSCRPENTPVHSPKLASSAAELAGHNRVMSEPCPVADGPNEPPLDAIRGHLNILLLGGITDFNCYLRLKGCSRAQRLRLNTYVGRVAMLLRPGHTVAEIGVVYPIESLWTKYTPRYHKVAGWNQVMGAAKCVQEIDKTFQGVSRCMFDHRWQYLHLDAQAIIEGESREGRLVHDTFQFKIIVLPVVSTLPAEAWSRLQTYVKAGGKIVLLEQMPVNSDVHFPDIGMQREFEGLVRDNENVVFLEDWTPKALNGLLVKWLKKPVEIKNERLPLRLAHKRTDTDDVFFVINDSANEITTDLTFHRHQELQEWDPSTGDMRSVPGVTTVTLKPYHGKLYTAPQASIH